MITRTETGYALDRWEAHLTSLSNGTRFTVREALVMLCKLTGMTHKETGRQIGSTDRNVESALQTVYYKTGTRNLMGAVNALIDEGALHRLPILFLVALLSNSAISSDSNVLRPRRQARQVARSARRGNAEAADTELPPVDLSNPVLIQGGAAHAV